MTLAEAHPADTCGQPLESNALARHIQPVVQMRIIRNQLFDLRISLVNIFGISRQRHPAERADTATKQRAHVGRDKAGKIEGIRQALFFRNLPDIIAVIECWYTRPRQIEHCLHVNFHRCPRGRFDVIRGRTGLFTPFSHRPACRQIAIDYIVRRGLICDHIGSHAASDEFRQNVRSVPH